MFAYLQVDRPYPGLRPFEPWETGIFFGRDIHIDRLQDILKSQHFLTVTGPSGSGKSSLVRAGLLPALPLGAIGTGSDWRAVIMRPGDKPLSSLAKALCDHYALGPELNQAEKSASTEINSTLPALEAELRRGPLGLVDLVKDLRQHARDPDFNLLILVDQFEEIFTYAEAGTYQADESDAFVNLLLAAGNNKEMRIFVIITMRTDFLGACTRFLGLPEMINRSLYLTPRLNREQLTQAIAGPAALFNLKLSADLVAEYVNAIQNEQDQLPVLQHALARRWDQLLEKKGLHADTTDYPEVDVFQTVDNLGQALSDHADTVYNTLTDEQKLNAQWLFRAITEQRITEGGGQTVRRPQSLARIAEWSGRSWKEFLPIIKAFADPTVSFLTYKSKPDQPGEPEDDEKTVIDISHEAVMRQWASLKSWINSEGKAAQEYREWRQRAARKDSGSGSYLSGADLSQAEAWLKQGLDFVAPSTQSAQPNSAPHAEWANRYHENKNSAHSFASIEAFILQSRDASQFSKRLLNLLGAFMVTACLIAAGFGYYSYQQSIESAAKSLWFRFKSDSRLTRGSGADDLITVAKQDKNIRLRFIEEILHDGNIATVFSSHPVLFLRASVQSDSSLRDQLLEKLRIADADADGKDSISLARIQALLELDTGEGIQQLLNTVAKNGDYKIIDKLGKERLVNYISKLNEDQVASIVALIQKTTDFHQLKAMGEGLVSLVDKLSESQATSVVAQVVEAIQETTNFYQLEALSKGLAPLAGKLSVSQAISVVAQYVEAIQKTTDPYQLEALGKGLAPLAVELSESQATSVVAHVVEVIQKTTDFHQLKAMDEGLVSLAGKLSESQANSVVAQVVEAIQETKDFYQLRALGEGLVSLAGKLSGSQATIIVAQVVEAIQETKDFYQLRALGEGLVSLADKLSESQATSVVAQVVEVIQKTKDPYQLRALGEGLVSLADKLSESQATSVVAQVVEAIQETTDPYQLRALGEGLVSLAGKLSESQATSVVAQVVEVIQKTMDPYQLRALSERLASLAGKLSENQATIIIAQYVEAIQEPTNSDRLRVLGEGLAPLAGKFNDIITGPIVGILLTEWEIRPSDAQVAALAEPINTLIPRLVLSENQTKVWLKLLDIPFIDRDAIATAIRKQYADAPGEDQGIWTFVKWANSYFGVNGPNKADLISATLEILLLPLLVLIGGGLLLQLLSGRKLVTLQLDKLANKKDRQNLGIRFTGYTAEQVKSHWSVLGADERMIEQRFLTMDLIFAPIYGATFLYALLKGAEYLDFPFSPAMLVALICTMILADWTENTIQLQQLKHMNQRGAVLQSGWIRIASLATQIKLLCGIIVMMLLLYICAQLLLF
ncbi:ATP-binding protein [Nitrosomonas sp.]|uniref:ATP-binding protein n=1 Tax=Nitrosomonas sp. TaxID=42353 RepID=UPI0026267D8E|nr:ATP-binding protein [Nitrosomonas sp.]